MIVIIMGNKFRQVRNEMLQWFGIDFMQANPSQFQNIVFAKSEEKRPMCLNGRVILQSQKSFKVLGSM